jgi:hypothetical protein
MRDQAVRMMVTDRVGAPPNGTTIETPAGRPNIVIQLMTPIAQVLVRGVRTYVQGVIGFLLLGLAARPVMENLGVVVPPGDFVEAVKVAGGLALAPAAISLLQNTAELLGKLDAMFPKLRA